MTALESSSPSSRPRAMRSLADGIGLRMRALARDLAASAPQADGWDAMVYLGAEMAEAHVRHKNAVRQVARVPVALDDADLRQIRRQLGRRHRKGVVLRLGPDRAIRTTMSLPASASDVLPAIVANKIETIAPWPAGEAIWGFRRLPAGASEVVTVDVAVASRRVTEEAVSRLAAGGLRVARIEAGESAAQDAGVALGSFGTGAIERSLHRMKAGAIIMVALALCAALPGAYLLLTDMAELDRIAQRTAALESELQARRQMADPSGRMQQALALVERKDAEWPFVTLLKTVTASLPDGIWLEALDYADGRLVLTGKGTPSPEVIEALEMSPALAKAGFAAATQRQAGEGVDSFSISASIESQGGTP